MSIEVIDKTKPKTTLHLGAKLEPAIRQLMKALQTAALGTYHQDPLSTLNQTEKVMVLLTALDRAYSNCLIDAKKEKLILGTTGDGFLIPHDNKDIPDDNEGTE